MLKFAKFSLKQRKVMSWWLPNSPMSDKDGIIADGSIRAGKTLPMSISFIEWAFHYFDEQAFAFAGKTVNSLRRNIIRWLKPLLALRGYTVRDQRDENLLTITKNGKTNYFYLFGGKDERSQDLIQGATLAGILFDEVALMPQSFVNQATGRCSVEGSKLWFNCNPDSPSHWFKKEWLEKLDEKKLLHLHFTMDDNPSLSDETKLKYHRRYVGVFFKRMILGLWVVAEGAIYDMFSEENQYDELPFHPEDPAYDVSRYIAIDYGTQNPMVFLDIIDDGETAWVEEEYFYDGRKNGVQKTDSQYADDLDAFTKGKQISRVIIDPSAASFIAELKTRSYRVKEADNSVLDGIRMTATSFARRIVRVNKRCVNLIRELGSYCWDTKPTEKGKEQPLKRDDHACDALRYFVKTIFKKWRFAA